MFEIGSEFWTENGGDGSGLKSLVPYNTNVIYTLCGRTALDIIVKDILAQRKARTLYMPSYCCHTMIEPFLRIGLEVEYYNVVATDNGIKCDLRNNECDLIFLIDYFGFIDNEIRDFAEKERIKGKTIIYDATHALFCENLDYSGYDYVFGSFRKWTGINAGFAAKHGKWGKKPILKHNNEYEMLRNKSFDLKAAFIQKPDSVDKSKFLSSFQAAEKLLENNYQNYAPDSRSSGLLYTLDIVKIRESRRRNASLLLNGLEECNKVFLPYKTVKSDECPLFVPMIVKNDRDTVRKHLINHSIYLPVHWPISSKHCLKAVSRMIYDEEMSCVCDQRYSERDMEYIVKIIKQNY